MRLLNNLIKSWLIKTMIWGERERKADEEYDELRKGKSITVLTKFTLVSVSVSIVGDVVQVNVEHK